jgi:steroid 5-alpha reductase family enzyme
MTRNGIAVVATIVSVAIAALVAWAVGVDSVERAGLPAIYWCVIGAFALNWIAFIPSWIKETEHFFDLTGATTYISVTVLAFLLGTNGQSTSILMAVLVFIWAGRLGSFLFRRISRDGGDRRFNKIRSNPVRLFETWTLQALWVSLTAMAAWVGITSVDGAEFGALPVIGLVIWIAGFAIEVKADTEKSAFKKDPVNDGKFISTGIWAWSRHPNYFGEITLWAGITLIAIPGFDGREFVALVSPLFVLLLLTKISGLPALERRGLKRWGDDADYQRYLAEVPILIPRPPSK